MRPVLMWLPAAVLACGSPQTANTSASTSTSASTTATVPRWEGFFDPRTVSQAWLDERGIEVRAATIRAPLDRLGKLVIARGDAEAPEAELDARYQRYCSPDARPWNQALCGALEGRICDDSGCMYQDFGNCSGLFVGGGRFVTASHCVIGLRDDPELRRRSVLLRGPTARRVGIGEIEGRKEELTHHFVSLREPRPVDVATIEVDDGGLSVWEPAPVPNAGEPVFILGFPRAERRSDADRARAGYDLRFGVPSVSFGEVRNVNVEDAPLCSVDGLQEHWQLQSPCPARETVVDGETAYEGPIGFGVFLASYDSVNGYSGGPVFDVQGNWVGVNSTLVGSDNPQDRYGDDFMAVAVRAAEAD